MDLKTLKLQLIQRILQTQDAGLLQTALKVLELGGRPSDAPPPREEPPVLPQGRPPQDEEVKQLQRDIDELFNP
ncbi:MAG: hypothetical protein J5I98_24110 [Phaeodactylibacter sp.]|nr:hypothetical protein [Phaeodactylibacter sp.]